MEETVAGNSEVDDEGLVRLTAIPPVALWFAALIGFAPRFTWCIGCGTYLVHVAVAFHSVHGWSHVNAMNHVELSSGWGEGIFFSYAFTVIWLVDAIWWLIAPRSYSRRSRLLHLSIHLYLAFIIFNATVIFGHGFAWWFGIVIFATLLLRATNVAGRRPPRRE